MRILWCGFTCIQGGDLIASLDLDDPSAVRKALPFEDSFPPLGLPTAIAAKVHQRCADSLNAARNILAGYEHDLDEVFETHVEHGEIQSYLFGKLARSVQ